MHVSTAYVSGAYEGTFRERQLEAGQRFRNTYEQTKLEAEQIVAAASDLSPAVARPSIVMGESDTGWTPAFNVLYWPLRAFSRGLFDTVPADPAGRVDVVPVDYVADAIVHLLDRGEAGVFNLMAGREAPTVEELIELGSVRFGRPRPKLVAPGGPTGLQDGEVYVPYFDMRVVFDDSRARALLAPAGIRAAAAGRVLRQADRLRGGDALGQAADDPRGGARALRGRRRGLTELHARANSARARSATASGRSSGTKWPQPSRTSGARVVAVRLEAVGEVRAERVAAADHEPRGHAEPLPARPPGGERPELTRQERAVHPRRRARVLRL